MILLSLILLFTPIKMGDLNITSPYISYIFHFFKNPNLSLFFFPPAAFVHPSIHSSLLPAMHLASEFFSYSPTQVFFQQQSKVPTQKSLSSTKSPHHPRFNASPFHIMDMFSEHVFWNDLFCL